LMEATEDDLQQSAQKWTLPGRWKKGHTGYVYNIGMECGDAQYDYAIKLDGDAFCSGFNENELEEDNT